MTKLTWLNTEVPLVLLSLGGHKSQLLSRLRLLTTLEVQCYV